MSDALRRAIRTLLQAILGALGAGALNVLFKGLDPEILAIIGIVLTTIITQIQNALEDTGAIPAFLKSPASPGVNPVPVDGGNLTEEVREAVRDIKD